MPSSTQLDARRHFGTRLSQAARLWRRAVDARLQPYGLSDATWLPLIYAARHPEPMRQKDLAEAIGIDPSTLVRLLDALAENGLVEREADTDRRNRIVRPTAAGWALAERVEAAIEELRGAFLGGIGDAELAAALDVIERVRGRIDQALKDAPVAAK